MNTPPTPELHLYDTVAAAGILGKSPGWVRAQAAAGVIPHRRIGSTYRFTADDIAAYLESVKSVDPWVRTKSRRAS
jgi:hypothetical protein